MTFKQNRLQPTQVAFGSLAPLWPSAGYFRSSPISRPFSGPSACLKGANSGSRSYSITSSARDRRPGATVRPRALAVLRLITSSNFDGCSIGRSAGLLPLSILST